MKVVYVAVALLGYFSMVTVGYQRPVWNLGHMVNAVKQVHSFLDDGANALESDVTFNKRGVAEYTYHGVPCDCFRNCLRWEYFTTFLEYISDVSTPGSSLYRENYVLQFLDLKISSLSMAVKETAMRDVTQKIITHFYKNGRRNSRLKFQFSLPHSNDIDLVRIVHETLRNAGLGHLTSHIGFDVYSYEDIGSIKSKWQSSKKTENIWQGDGITNCLPRNTGRLLQAIRLRDSSTDSYMHKVYYWTVDKRSTMIYSLEAGVDGIMTNHPNRLRDLLKEPSMNNRFRLATHSDNPFETIKPQHREYAQEILPETLYNVEDDEVFEPYEKFEPLPNSSQT